MCILRTTPKNSAVPKTVVGAVTPGEQMAGPMLRSGRGFLRSTGKAVWIVMPPGSAAGTRRKEGGFQVYHLAHQTMRLPWGRHEVGGGRQTARPGGARNVRGCGRTTKPGVSQWELRGMVVSTTGLYLPVRGDLGHLGLGRRHWYRSCYRCRGSAAGGTRAVCLGPEGRAVGCVDA